MDTISARATTTGGKAVTRVEEYGIMEWNYESPNSDSPLHGMPTFTEGELDQAVK